MRESGERTWLFMFAEMLFLKIHSENFTGRDGNGILEKYADLLYDLQDYKGYTRDILK